MKSPSLGKVIGASALGLIIGLLQPALLAVNLILCVMPVLICVLYAWAGWIPAAVAAATTLGSVSVFASAGGVNAYAAGAAAFAVLVLPGLTGVMLLKGQIPFFRRMGVSVALQALVMAAAAGAAYQIFRVDLVDAFTGRAREAMGAMPPDMVQLMLSSFAAGGLLTEESINGLSRGIVTWFDVNRALDQAFEELNYQLRQTAPAMMLNSALLTGVFMTALSGRTLARREGEPRPTEQVILVDGRPAGEGTNAEKRTYYVPLSDWFLPAQAVGGLVVSLAVSLALVAMNVFEGVGAATVLLTLGATVFSIQGAAALSRAFRARGMGRGGRVALIVVGAILARRFLEITGILSALFGRRGVISTWLRRRAEEQGKDDDDE